MASKRQSCSVDCLILGCKDTSKTCRLYVLKMGVAKIAAHFAHHFVARPAPIIPAATYDSSYAMITFLPKTFVVASFLYKEH